MNFCTIITNSLQISRENKTLVINFENRSGYLLEYSRRIGLMYVM
jgi:hypothetical protein